MLQAVLRFNLKLVLVNDKIILNHVFDIGRPLKQLIGMRFIKIRKFFPLLFNGFS